MRWRRASYRSLAATAALCASCSLAVGEVASPADEPRETIDAGRLAGDGRDGDGGRGDGGRGDGGRGDGGAVAHRDDDGGACGWRPLATSGETPAPRRFASVAFDEAGDALVVVGGESLEDARLLDEVWRLDLGAGGARWERLSPAASEPLGHTPRPHAATASAFDPRERRLYLYGGPHEDGSGRVGAPADHVFALDLGGAPRWIEIVVTLATVEANSPRARIFAAAFFDDDPPRGFAVHGGHSDQAGARFAITADMRELQLDDGGSGAPLTWRFASAYGPARSGHVLVKDPVARRLVSFGGLMENERGVELSNESWTFDLAARYAWSRSTPPCSPGPECPEARMHAAAVYDLDGERLVLHAGLGDDPTAGASARVALRDTWSLPLDAGAPQTPPRWRQAVLAWPDTPRYGHGLIHDTRRGRLVVYGGTRTVSQVAVLPLGCL